MSKDIIIEEALIPRGDVEARIIAAGVNSLHRVYNEDGKKLYNDFVKSKLTFIAPSWDYLSNDVKVSVINAHTDEFKAFVSGSK